MNPNDIFQIRRLSRFLEASPQVMTATAAPRRLELEHKPHSYRYPSPSPDSSSDDMDANRTPPKLPSPSLPGRRVTRAARSRINSRKLLPRIDTEKPKNLCCLEQQSNARIVAARDARQQHFQRYRDFLWKMGRTNLGNREGLHVSIVPVQLSAKSPELSSKSSTTISTVVHSEGRSPIILSRQFDRSLLSATVPEPAPSPSTPNFDPEQILSAIVDKNETQPAKRRRRSARAAALKRNTPCTVQELTLEGIPMHFSYARSYLPVIASIIMSRKVLQGDTVVLPLPFPKAWAETVAWVYTGEEKLLTDKVTENVQYLGGRVLSIKKNEGEGEEEKKSLSTSLGCR